MSECEVDGSEAKSTTATSDKKIQDSERSERGNLKKPAPVDKKLSLYKSYHSIHLFLHTNHQDPVFAS